EIARVVAHVKEQGRPVYDETIVEEKNVGEDGLPAIEQEYDELYDMAVKLVAETKQASISMIQRRFRIGYNRAARLVEKMEAEGVVGPADGAKPREVLVSSLQERG
ncbi:MAG: DNA translocase FtsK, partial [Deltaproteobacteria bacterium]|nr:DNA translocase FtsK [Deltaproteobacteria bacterium]